MPGIWHWQKGYLDICRLLNSHVLSTFSSSLPFPPLALAFALKLFQSANSSHFHRVFVPFWSPEVLTLYPCGYPSLLHSVALSLFCGESSVSFAVCLSSQTCRYVVWKIFKREVLAAVFPRRLIVDVVLGLLLTPCCPCCPYLPRLHRFVPFFPLTNIVFPHHF